MSRSNMPSSENINKPRSYSERSHTSLSDSPRLGVSNSSRPGANRKRAPQTRKTVNWRVVSGLTLLLLLIPYIVISLAFSQSSGALGNAVANCLNNSFGFASWMVPILLGAVSAALLENTKGQKYSLQWFLPLMLASSLLMASKLGHRGGALGTAIDNTVTHFVGDAGAWIAVLGCIFCAFIIFWQLSPSQVQYGLKIFSEWVQIAALKTGQFTLKGLKILGKFLFVFMVWAGTQIVKLWRASLAKGREKWEERKQAKAYREEDFEYIDDYYDDEIADERESVQFSFDDLNNNEATVRYGANDNILREPAYSERYENTARENPLNPFEYGSHREPAPVANNVSNPENDLEGTSVFTGDMLGRTRQEEFVSEMVACDTGFSGNPAAANVHANESVSHSAQNNYASSKVPPATADNKNEHNDIIAASSLDEPSNINVKEPGTLNFNDIFDNSDKDGIKPAARPIGRRSGSSAVRQNKGHIAPVEPSNKLAEAAYGEEHQIARPQIADNNNADGLAESAANASPSRASKPKMSYQDALCALTGRRPKKSSDSANNEKSSSKDSLNEPAETAQDAAQQNNAAQVMEDRKAGSSGERVVSASPSRASKPKMSYQDALCALTGRRPKKSSDNANNEKSSSNDSLKAPSETAQVSAQQNNAAQVMENRKASNSAESVANTSPSRSSKQKMSYQDALYALTGRRPKKSSENQNNDKSTSGESLKAHAETASVAEASRGAEQHNETPKAAESPKAASSGERAVSTSPSRASKPKMSYQDALYALTGRRPKKSSENQNNDKSASDEPLKAHAVTVQVAEASRGAERQSQAPQTVAQQPASSAESADISKQVSTSAGRTNTGVSADVPQHNAGSTLAAASALLSPGQSESSQVSLSGFSGDDYEASVEMLAIKAADIRQAEQAKAYSSDNKTHDTAASALNGEKASSHVNCGQISGTANNIANSPRMNPQGELKRDEKREELKKRSPEEFLNSIGIRVRPKKIGGILNNAAAPGQSTTIVPDSATMDSSDSEQDHGGTSQIDKAKTNNRRAYDDLRQSLGLSALRPAAVSPKPAASVPRPAAAESKPAAPAPRPAAVESKPAAPTSRPAAVESNPAAPAPRPAAVESKPAAPASRPAVPASAFPVNEKRDDTPAFLEISRRNQNQQNVAADSSQTNDELSAKIASSAPKAGLVPKALALKPSFSKQFEDRASRERYSPLMAKQMMPKPGLSASLSSKPMLDKAYPKPVLDKKLSKPVLDINVSGASGQNRLDVPAPQPAETPALRTAVSGLSLPVAPVSEKPAIEKPALANPIHEMPKLELSALERNGSVAKNPASSSSAASLPGSRGGLKIGSLFKDIDDPSSVHDVSGEYDLSAEYESSGEYVSGEYEASGEYYEDGEYVSGEYETSGEYYDSQEYDESCEYEAEDEHIVTDELEYELPPIDLLNDGNGLVCRKSEDKSEALLEVLKSFKVEATLHNIVHGPAVTRYELKPAKGVSVKKFTNLQDDIALALAAKSLRIEAPVPGRPVVGIEVPNDSTELVALKDILDSDSFCSGRGLRVGLGKDITGLARTTDLVKMPHLLVAGTTGSGKSVCINTIILSLLYKFTPKHLQLLMIDPKQVELSIYKGIPHLIGLAGEESGQIITDAKKAEAALRQAVELMETRYTLLAAKNVRNIDEYNAKVDDYLPWVVIIIDELADLMMVAAKSIEVSICRLAQKARAAGIHLVVATQRPSTDVITGLMKVNIPSRIAFAVSSQVDSRVILDMNGAEHLLGKGDMLFKSVDSFDAVRIQGAFVTNEEIERVVEFWRSQGTPDNKIELDITEPEPEESAKDAEEVNSADEELVKQALELILKKQQASASMLQTGLRIGYARARRVIEILEERGYVGPSEGSKPRKIYYTGEES